MDKSHCSLLKIKFELKKNTNSGDINLKNFVARKLSRLYFYTQAEKTY